VCAKLLAWTKLEEYQVNLIDSERKKFEESLIINLKEKDKVVHVPAIKNKQAHLYGYLLAATG